MTGTKSGGIHSEGHSRRGRIPDSPFRYDAMLDDARTNFADYMTWADTHPDLVENHIEKYSQRFTQIKREDAFVQRLRRRMAGKEAASHASPVDEVQYFALVNMAKIVSASRAEEIARGSAVYTMQSARRHGSRRTSTSYGTVRDKLQLAFPELHGTPEAAWLEARMNHLRTILPEFTVEESIGKAIRTALGVMALAGYGGDETGRDSRIQRVRSATRMAGDYGISYAIIDDVLQDSGYALHDSQNKYRDAIVHGMRTGDDLDGFALPDHPLTEEMLRVYDDVRQEFPRADNLDLYEALTSMYLAQDADETLGAGEIQDALDVYPTVAIKASLSRVVANMFARNDLTPEQSQRLVRSLLRNQFSDDTCDWRDDRAAGLKTPHTLWAANPELPIGNPMMHFLAYEAYIVHELYGGDEHVAHMLVNYSVNELGRFFTDAEWANDTARHFGDDGVLSDMMQTAQTIRRPTAYPLRFDQKLRSYEDIPRDRQDTDPRTFISDVIGEINELLDAEYEVDGDNANPLNEVIRYSLDAGGKRVRPALTLMLAESLGVDREKLAPLIIAVELAHTASLVFDDLPAQDDASLRRGRPTSHVEFGEDAAQLAAIAMINESYAIITRLNKDYPDAAVIKMANYFGQALGKDRLCLGQYKDLRLKDDATLEEILEMYNLKTSSLIEAALMPLMILEERTDEESAHVHDYAYHAGIAFQLRDDILDATSSADVTGKDSHHDTGKHNIYTKFGSEVAETQLDYHLRAAITACEKLEFPTNLLENLVRYFATRKK